MSDDLDDFMDSIGLDVKPVSAEDVLMIRLTGGGTQGGYKEIHNFRYWLRHEIFTTYDLIKHGLQITKQSLDPISKVPIQIPATKDDIVKIHTMYYIRMKYKGYLDTDWAGLGKIDLNKMADMMIAHEDVRSMIDTEPDKLPNNQY